MVILYPFLFLLPTIYANGALAPSPISKMERRDILLVVLGAKEA
jgi:hypothetical protein